jgi:hypothetical protein
MKFTSKNINGRGCVALVKDTLFDPPFAAGSNKVYVARVKRYKDGIA